MSSETQQKNVAHDAGQVKRNDILLRARVNYERGHSTRRIHGKANPADLISIEITRPNGSTIQKVMADLEGRWSMEIPRFSEYRIAAIKPVRVSAA